LRRPSQKIARHNAAASCWGTVFQNVAQRILAFVQRLIAQVEVFKEWQVEREEDQPFRLLAGKGRLQHREIGDAALVQRHDFAVIDAVRKHAAIPRDFGEAGGPIEPLAGAQYRAPIGHAGLHTITVEFHLMCPIGTVGRMGDDLTEFGFDEFGQPYARLFFLFSGFFFFRARVFSAQR